MRLLSADFVRKFEKEKRLRPGDYDYNNDIYPALKERPRFYQVTDFIDRINSLVPDETFSDRYTNHYFIHCHTLNDGFVSAVAICNMIYSKYTYEIGDYLVDKSRSKNAGAMPSNMSIQIIPTLIQEDSVEKSDETDKVSDEEEVNASVFLYHKTDHNEIFMYDTEGVKVCFVIYADDMMNNNNNVMSSFFESGTSILPPQQAAAQLHYTYLDISEDQSDELAGIIVDQINKNGFSCERVKKQILALSKHPLVTDEYKAVAAAKRVINNHINFFGASGDMLPVDFSDYVQSKQSLKKVDYKSKLVGLEKELGIIKGAVNSLSFDIERCSRGLADDVSGCNMVFTGQPGTAKTTIAREFAKLLVEKKIIPGIENFRECRKSDIVGQYVGHTAKKVDDMFKELDSSGGGVIFFDEIYTLSEKNNTCFDTEAINCITQNMENYRSKVFCVFAGYENKMNEFIDANPGLSSRISTSVKFSRYDNDTLCRIFDNFVRSNNFTVDGDYHSIMNDFFEELRKLRGNNFGNGREARNLFENAKRFTADRVMQNNKPTKAMLSVITVQDISSAAKEILDSVITGNNSKMNSIGF